MTSKKHKNISLDVNSTCYELTASKLAKASNFLDGFLLGLSLGRNNPYGENLSPTQTQQLQQIKSALSDGLIALTDAARTIRETSNSKED